MQLSGNYYSGYNPSYSADSYQAATMQKVIMELSGTNQAADWLPDSRLHAVMHDKNFESVTDCQCAMM
jgi:hypothetical protein